MIDDQTTKQISQSPLTDLINNPGLRAIADSFSMDLTGKPRAWLETVGTRHVLTP
jgi:hypothetical protein